MLGSKDDFSPLADMIYSGRGITMGMTPSGKPFIGYSLTGRSPSSQARELVYDDNGEGVIRTSVTDEEKLRKGSPALLLYPAIAGLSTADVGFDGIVASNGAQTKLIFTLANNNVRLTPQKALEEAFEEPFYEYDQKLGWVDITEFEPDESNSTPRITAFIDYSNTPAKAAFHIVRRKGNEAEGEIHPIILKPGKGHLITTYKGGNEKPLLPFVGSPPEVRIGSEDVQMIANSIYDAIEGGQEPGDNYRVAAAVMALNEGKLETVVRNRSTIGS